MTKLQIEKPKTLPEFISLIEKARKKSGNPLWYRGWGFLLYFLAIPTFL